MEKIKGKEYIRDIVNIGKEKLEEGDREYLDYEIDDKALATLVFTSGTTSKSKIVMLSQYNIARNISDMQLVEDFRSTDVNLAFLPYHHTFGSTRSTYNVEFRNYNSFSRWLKIYCSKS